MVVFIISFGLPNIFPLSSRSGSNPRDSPLPPDIHPLTPATCPPGPLLYFSPGPNYYSPTDSYYLLPDPCSRPSMVPSSSLPMRSSSTSWPRGGSRCQATLMIDALV